MTSLIKSCQRSLAKPDIGAPSFLMNRSSTTRFFFRFQALVTSNNSSVSKLEFNQTLKEIRFDVEGTSGTKGFCNITIPKELLLGEISVYKDDTLLINGTDYIKTQNASYWSFYITFEHSGIYT